MIVSGDGIAYRVDGSGQPVVLVHSGVADQRTWDEVAARLVRSYTVIRYDMRGFGASPPPVAKFRHLDDLVALMDRMGVEQATLVGNSLGGKLALDVAGAMPERVSRLVLLAPPIAGWDWSRTMRDYSAAEGKALAAGDLDTAVKVNLDMWVRGPARPWSEPLRALADRVEPAMRIALANQTATEEQELDDEFPPVEDGLAALPIPALIGIGDEDVPDFIAIAERLAATIPAAELVRFGGAGHLIPLEQPEQTAGHIERFLTAP